MPKLQIRKLGSIPYVAGGRESLELDKDGVLLGLQLRLRYTITNGATDPAGARFQTLSRLIQRIEVTAAGRDTVQSVPGFLLAARAFVEAGRVAFGMDKAISSGNGATTAVDVVLPVDFTLPLGQREDDTGLDTLGLSQLSLYVNWGSGVGELFNTVNAATVTNVTLDVEGRYVIEPNRVRPYLMRSLDFEEVSITASNTNFGLTIDSRTGTLIQSLLLVQAEALIGTDAIVNSFRLEAGALVYANRDAPHVRAENQRMLNIVPQTGVLYLEPRWLGSILYGIDTRVGVMPSDLKVIADVTAGAASKLIVQREGMREMLKTTTPVG